MISTFPPSNLFAQNQPSTSGKAVYVLTNKQNLLPLQQLDTLKVGVLALEREQPGIFEEYLGLYTHISIQTYPNETLKMEMSDYLTWAGQLDLVIVAWHASPYGLAREFTAQFLEALGQKPSPHAVLAVFGDGERIAQLPQPEKLDAILWTAQEDAAEKRAAQVIFGGLGTSDRLPQDLGARFRQGHGLAISPLNRLAYTGAAEAGMDGARLSQKIDSLVGVALDSGAFPGCQVLVARHGKVLHLKAYGHHTYSRDQPVQLDDLYDLASITKITTGLPALMKLHDQGRFPLDVPFSRYWPDFRGTDKANITPRQALAHYARLIPYISYWQNTVRKNGRFKWFTFKQDSSKRFPVKVDEHLYLHRKYRQKIYKAIRKSPLLEEKAYVYSGLTFLLYPQIVQNLAGQPLDQYLMHNFYHPLGAYNLTFNPYQRFPLSRIVPTEFDSLFRKRQIAGYVHDEAAAMMGGVSGNAGLFANANDLAKLMQMYLQMGSFGGETYIADTTMQEFTRYQYKSEGIRRGLGFDKPLLENKENGFPAVAASEKSFGHSGFTGTFTWADPETGLLLVFLSNRVHPTRENRKVYRLDTYQQIHTAMYDALLD